MPTTGGTNDFCVEKENSIKFINNDNDSFNIALSFARDLDKNNYRKMIKKAYNKSLDFSWVNTANNTKLIKDKYFEQYK